MNEEISPLKTYLASEIFEDIPDDPENCMMKIPPEIYEALGWQEGDNLKITVNDGIITITKL
jgi:AbrB family looped-hinge helix DNA binding protein